MGIPSMIHVTGACTRTSLNEALIPISKKQNGYKTFTKALLYLCCITSTPF